MFNSTWFEEIYGQGQLAVAKCTQTLVRLFRSNEIKDHPNKKDKSGKALQYLDTSSCIDRLNEAFTPLGWSFELGEPVYPPLPSDNSVLAPHNVAVIGVLTVHTPWGDVRKTQYGSAIMKCLWDSSARKFGTPTAYAQQYAEFGDDLKGAGSDALKKCATLMGVGNYISRKGTAQVEQDAMDALNELVKVASEKGLTREQMLEFCGGVTRKTVRGAQDLSLTQTQACIALLKEMPQIAMQLTTV